MDARMEPPPSQRLRISKDQGLDIISNLPDEIIHHVLSYAPTKDAVRTCILSNRWLTLRTSSPTIVLADNPSTGVRVGLDDVDRTLASHDFSDIRELRLVLSSRVNLTHLRSWLLIAKTHNVQNLELILDVAAPYELPLWLYGCQRLVKLKLDMQTILNTPRITQLSNLRSLHLSKVIFYCCLSFQLILTSCSVLEELELVNCDWTYVGSLMVTMPTLRSLTVEQRLAQGDILNSCISFEAPNLSSFTCSSNLKVFFCLHQVASLERAFLDLVLATARTSPRAIRLITSIRYVKHLSIATKSMYFFLALHEHYQQNLEPYENLIHLEIKTKYNVRRTHLFLRFLIKMPNLEFLDLSQGVGRSPIYEGTLAGLVAPDCFHSSLKNIRIATFEGRPEEMALLKFILENATVLERLIINFSDKLASNPEQLMEVSHLVEVIPRVSGKLLISYSDLLLVDMES